MRKIVFILFLLLSLLTACVQKEIKAYDDTDIDEFNKVLDNVGNGKTKAYDLREYDECYNGRIPGFYCSRVYQSENKKEDLDKIIDNLKLLLGDKKRTMIILMDNNDGNAAVVAQELFISGYKNIHYFKNGYDRYVELQPDFVPEAGDCDC